MTVEDRRTCCACVPSPSPCLCSWTSVDHGICSVSCPMFDSSGGCWSDFGVLSCPSPCLSLCPAPCLSPSRVPSLSHVPSPFHVLSRAPSPSLPPLCAFSPFPPSLAHGLPCPSSALGFQVGDLLSGDVVSPMNK